MQNVLHGTSAHPSLVKKRSGLLDDALPGFLSFAHGGYQISKKRRIGLFSGESIQRQSPGAFGTLAPAVSINEF
jgi:hypothetical protein